MVKNIIHESKTHILEIEGGGICYKLVNKDKKTGYGKKVFVDGNTTFNQFKKDCKKYIPKEEPKE